MDRDEQKCIWLHLNLWRDCRGFLIMNEKLNGWMFMFFGRCCFRVYFDCF